MASCGEEAARLALCRVPCDLHTGKHIIMKHQTREECAAGHCLRYTLIKVAFTILHAILNEQLVAVSELQRVCERAVFHK